MEKNKTTYKAAHLRRLYIIDTRTGKMKGYYNINQTNKPR